MTPKHQHQSSTVSANGTTEVSTVQPVPLRPGRGARLSFLGGRKKEAPQQQQAAQVNGGQGHLIETRSSGSNSKGADTHRKRSIRAQSRENQRLGLGVAGSTSNGTHSNGPLSRSGTEVSEWVTDSGSHASHDTRLLASTSMDSIETKEREDMAMAGTPKLGGMKKRLSLLRLGKKTGRGNDDMGALDEE